MPRQPRYREIEAYLRERLTTASIGDLLPTVAELCEQFGVTGVQTVRNAYEPLVAEGLVEVQMRPRRRWIVAKVPVAPLLEEDGGTWDLLAAQDALAEAATAISVAQSNIARLLRNRS